MANNVDANFGIYVLLGELRWRLWRCCWGIDSDWVTVLHEPNRGSNGRIDDATVQGKGIK
jgi:hypothetical protein